MSKNDLLAKEYRESVDMTAKIVPWITVSLLLVTCKFWHGLNTFEHIVFIVTCAFGIYQYIEWYILKRKYYKMILEQFDERADAWEDKDE